MQLRTKGLKALFFLNFVILVTLSCKIPITLDRFYYFDEESEKHTLVAEYDATIVSAEGSPVELRLADGMEWICQDVRGEVFALSVGELPNFKYHEAKIDWRIQYRDYGRDDGFNVYYDKSIDRDYAVAEEDGLFALSN